MIDVYLGLGSNLSEPQSQIARALKAISQLPECSIYRCSSLYGSVPMGPQNQPDFTNAVVWLRTTLPALTLLQASQAIELAQGRERKGQRWGPRSLDIDILLYGDEIIESEVLTVPHYGMKTREFVLYPLQEISPQLRLPDGQALAELLQHCPLNQLKMLSPAPAF